MAGQPTYANRLSLSYSHRFLVCMHKDGKPINPDSLSSYFRAVMEDAGFQGMSFHGPRHSHATILLGWDVHPKKVSERLGHSSTKLAMDTYSRYSYNAG